jgi:undecaprenyl-diphosphatase
LLLRILFVVLIVLTALSRMYLGVHTPADVLVSLAIGAVLVFALYPAFRNAEKNPGPMYIAMGVLVVCSAAFVLFVERNQWPADIDPHNLESGVKNAWLLLGVGTAMMIAAPVERSCINFSTKAPFWAQVLKIVLGLGIVLGLKAGLKPPLVGLFNGHHVATAVRYFVLVIFAALVWPLTFPWFAKGCPIRRRAKKTRRRVSKF